MRAVLAAALGAVAVAGVAGPVASAGAASAPAEPACAPNGAVRYVCGIAGPEDIVAVPGSPWLIAGAMGGPQGPGGLFALDTRTLALHRIYPAPAVEARPGTATYAACPGAPDPKPFQGHGLSIRSLGPGKARLLVVHHGDRESIEVFDLATGADAPKPTWIGCVLAPKGASLNSVVGLASGEILATSLYDAPAAMNDLFKGVPTGRVYAWKPGGRFLALPGTHLSGDNGIEVSRDGRYLFVAATGTSNLFRFDRSKPGQAPAVAGLGFAPDNLRWAADGRLLVAGQTPEPSCRGDVNCPHGFAVAAVDPVSLKAATIARGGPNPLFRGVSAGLVAAGRVWLGSYTGDRVGYVPAPK